MRLLAAIPVLLFTTGCASMINGSKEGVRVISDPPGGAVSVAGEARGVAPLVVQVSRGKPEAITIAIPTCSPLTVTPKQDVSMLLWANAFLGPVGLATAGVDFVTGGAYDLQNTVGARCVNGVAHPANMVVVGMTTEQVRAAWGDPVRINRTQTAAGEDEQWVYGLGYYVYVRGGRVTAVQTIEGN